MNWEVLQDISNLQKELREENMISNVKIKFNLIGIKQEYSAVENINIDRIRVQRKMMYSEDNILQVVCKVQLKGEKKELQIISPLSLSNMTGHNINVQLVDKEDKCK